MEFKGTDLPRVQLLSMVLWRPCPSPLLRLYPHPFGKEDHRTNAGRTTVAHLKEVAKQLCSKENAAMF